MGRDLYRLQLVTQAVLLERTCGKCAASSMFPADVWHMSAA